MKVVSEREVDIDNFYKTIKLGVEKITESMPLIEISFHKFKGVFEIDE